LDKRSILDSSLIKDKLISKYQKNELVASFLGTKSNTPIATIKIIPLVSIIKIKVDIRNRKRRKRRSHRIDFMITGP